MAYKYKYGDFIRHVEILPGYHRFKSSCAQECKIVLNMDDMPRFIVWQFISYETPIIKVSRDLKYYSWRIVCNGNPFGYSRTTTRQVQKWINSHAFPFTPKDLRAAFGDCKSITPDVSSFRITGDDGIALSFEFLNNRSFARAWRK